MTRFTFVACKIGMQHVWGWVGSFVIFTMSMVFVAVVTELSRKFYKSLNV